MVMPKSKTDIDQGVAGVVILKKQGDGRLSWVQAAKDLASAKERVRALGEFFPGEYRIINQKTESEISILIDPNLDNQGAQA